MSGVTLTGFEQPSLDDLKQSIESALKASFGQSIDLDPQSNFGQFIGVMAERFADLWAMGAAIDLSFNPDSATGTALDNLVAITGTLRRQATFSTAVLSLTGTNGTVVPLGSVASIPVVGTRFALGADVTLATAAAWASTTGYATGDIVRNGATQRIYVCITAGTSAGSGGPDAVSADITDGTVHWKFVGTGAAYGTGASTCSKTGPFFAAAGDLTVIATPFAGWSSVNNLEDSTLGTDLETDSALRLRRTLELRLGGKASVESIRAALLEVEGVTNATVFENVTDTTDGDGVPPHSIEALVQGGTDSAVRASIFSEIAAGIGTHGSVTGTVVDSVGTVHEIDFTRPTEIPIYVGLELLVDATLWPIDGDVQSKDLVVEWGDVQKAGKDVVSSAIGALIFKIPGLLDVVAKISTAPTPTLTTTIPINSRQLATYSTVHITVAVTPGTP